MIALSRLRRRLRARRLDGDRGAALTEFGLMIPLLLALAMGIAEFGLAWRASLTVANTLRAAARVGSNAGDDRYADLNALQALNAAVEDIPTAQIERIVIFNARHRDEPTSGCKAGFESSVNDHECNVYEPNDLDDDEGDYPGSSFCASSSEDKWWCPLGRETDQGSDLDTFGVWIRVNHPYITGMFPGDGITIEDSAVMRLEPS